MNDKIDQLPPLRDVISNHDLRARKSLGQNFLLDLNLTRKIARQAGDLTNCDVLEVGPGPGGLTRALLSEGARRVVAIERDERCLPALAEIEAVSDGRLVVHAGDALDFNPNLHLTAPTKIVANLPYNVGTELLIRWLTPPEWPAFWTSLTLMFQREVALRITATPGSKAYGRLSILSQWRTDAKLMFDVPAQAFSPAPKVTSSIVHLSRLDKPRYPAEYKTLSKLTAAAFGQRRKMLRASLKSLAPDIQDILNSVDIPPTARAEEIPLEGFCKLSCALDAYHRTTKA